MLITYGVGAKNLRSVAECLDEVAEFIKSYGIDYTSEKEIKLIAKMADHADKSIRENALKTLGEVYRLLGDDIWRVIGEVTVKV
jgi:cytoskeleton-associated protein 5